MQQAANETFIFLEARPSFPTLKYNKIILSTMLSVSCRDVGVDCDFKGSGETEEELMNNLVDHAIKDHGYTREDVMKPEMQEKIKAHIQKSYFQPSQVRGYFFPLMRQMVLRSKSKFVYSNELTSLPRVWEL